MTHEPKRFLEGFQEALCSPDKRIAFLFGAGSSSAINIAPPPVAGAEPTHEPLIPGIAVLTNKCGTDATAAGTQFQQAWEDLKAACAANGEEPHIENILSRLRITIDANAPTGNAFGLTTDQLRELEHTIQATIVRLTGPAEADIPDDIPQNLFARWVRGTRRTHGIEVFTTNYDILLERSLERANVPIFDGFVGSYEPYFSPNLVANPRLGTDTSWVGLWKLHGSVNWETRPHRTVRVGSPSTGAFIYPSHRKYDDSSKMPYVALMERLSRRVTIDGTLLITIGYSWGDEHINSAILAGLEEHPSVNVIATMRGDVTSNPRLLKHATEHKNLQIMGGPNAVIGGVQAAWEHVSPLDATSSKLVDHWFDTDAAAPEATTTPVTGRMKLGDFNDLAAFLNHLDTNRAWNTTP